MPTLKKHLFRSVRAAEAVIIAILVLSCGEAPRVTLSPSTQMADPERYFEVFRRWSREVSVLPFNGLDNILTATVTFQGPEFTDHYLERRIADLAASPADRAAIEKEVREAQAGGHLFYVTLMSAVADCDDLSMEEGPWTLRLKNDKGIEVAPISVEELDPPTPADTKYFVFDPKLRKAYRVRFPLTAEDGQPVLPGDTRYFELSFASALGRDSARWETTSN